METNEKETEIMKKEEFRQDYEDAVLHGYDFLVVAVREYGEQTEIIINHFVNVGNKMEYYIENYNDKLCLIRNQNIQIIKWMFV